MKKYIRNLIFHRWGTVLVLCVSFINDCVLDSNPPHNEMSRKFIVCPSKLHRALNGDVISFSNGNKMFLSHFKWVICYIESGQKKTIGYYSKIMENATMSVQPPITSHTNTHNGEWWIWMMIVNGGAEDKNLSWHPFFLGSRVLINQPVLSCMAFRHSSAFVCDDALKGERALMKRISKPFIAMAYFISGELWTPAFNLDVKKALASLSRLMIC